MPATVAWNLLQPIPILHPSNYWIRSIDRAKVACPAHSAIGSSRRGTLNLLGVIMYFLEHVVLKTGETVAIILDRYGIENSRWSEVRKLPQNARTFPSTGSSIAELRAGPPQVVSLYIPIGPFSTVVNYRIVRDTVYGLRPMNTAWSPQQRAKSVKETAHGLDYRLPPPLGSVNQ